MDTARPIAVTPAGYSYRTPAGHGIEIAVIDNGESIICLPTHTTAGETPVNLTCEEIVACVKLAYKKSVDDHGLDPAKSILISFIGCGEPIANMHAVVDSMLDPESCAGATGASMRFTATICLHSGERQNLAQTPVPAPVTREISVISESYP